MKTVEITTPRLRLVLQSPDQVTQWLASLPPEVRIEVSESWVERVRHARPGDFWALGFEIRLLEGEKSVGSIAFKGPPDGERVVELGYGIDPDHQGQGIATEAVSGLTNFAFESGEVSRVRAHTLPGNAASARVLTKCGFERLGMVEEPDDGLVERWEIRPDVVKWIDKAK